ncbi:MAG: DUF3568 family protein [Thermodesulfobacteriota bacterium]
MHRTIQRFGLFIVGAFMISGCAAAWVGGSALVAGSGTYLYLGGDMKTDYYHSFDTTWTACQKTVADMRGVNVQPYKEIGNGRITAVINDEKVRIDVTYKAKNLTTVTIRVGLLGNELSSQMIHDRIGDNLGRK